MKKYFIFAAVALVASAACTKTSLDQEATPDSPVTFQAANYAAQTKAGEVSVLNDFNEFKCKGFLHAEGIDLNSDGTIITSGTGKPSYQNFFGANGVTIKPYGSNGTALTGLTSASTGISYWAPEGHEYYWPKSTVSYINFVGWYGEGNAPNNDPTITYTYTSSKWTASLAWSFSNTTVGATGSNLLYSDMAWRYNDNPNAEYKKNGLANDYKGVPMLFHHALAQINVKAYIDGTDIAAGTTAGTVTDGTATWTVKLKDVVITPIYTGGTLNLTNEDPGTTSRQAWSGTGWTVGSTAGNYTVAGPTAVAEISKPAANGTTGDVIAKTCVLPQSLASVNLTFKLYIKTEYTGGTYNEEELSFSIPFTGDTTNLGTAAWAQNTKYTYYLKINPSQKTVRFDPALQADWSTGTTTEGTI